MEAAAGELKLSLGTQEALKSIAAATSCMKGIEGMTPEAVVLLWCGDIGVQDLWRV